MIALTPSRNERGEEMSIAHHLPGIQRAESIEEAAEYVKAMAFTQWKEEDGWYGHQAAIAAVTEEFYKTADDARNDGILDMSDDEPGQCFPFDSGLDSEFLA